jgi:hypothetical protein
MFTKYYFGDQIKGSKTGEACSTHDGRPEMVGESGKRNTQDRLRRGKKYNDEINLTESGREWSGLMWTGIDSGGDLL